jgi:hypothetical protein
MMRAALILILPLLVLSACDRPSTPPNVIPPNLAAKADTQGSVARDAATMQKTP